MTRDILGLDIGGANLKAAHSRGTARTEPFALWKNPAGLTGALRALVATMPTYDQLAVTMTGELCDCFGSKHEGVEAILKSVSDVAGRVPVQVWTTYGYFLPLTEARQEPLRVAAANWLAAATLAGKYVDAQSALYIDVGSTTTDIVELWKGRPVPTGWTDVERLKSGELAYTGVRRSPVCALLGPRVAAELFATTLDVYLALDLLPADKEDCDTADGRPATKPCAHVRLARMLGGDGETVSEQETAALARAAMSRQLEYIGHAVNSVCQCMPERPQTCVVAGSGEFLARHVADAAGMNVISLGEHLGNEISQAACAYAVALLASQ